MPFRFAECDCSAVRDARVGCFCKKKYVFKMEVVIEVLVVFNRLSLKSLKVAKARSAFVLRCRTEREISLEKTSLNF
jgi:hypothetical protein